MKLAVIAHPNAKKPRIETDLLGTLHVYVSEPPLEGKANVAVIVALATYCKVKKGDIRLLSGAKNKNKVFDIIRDKNS